MSRLRTALPAAAISLLAALVLAAPAGAGSYETFKTTVGISGKYPAFSGKLSSGNAYCKGYSKVKLWSEKNGPDKLLGSTESAAYGKWAIDVSAKLGSGAYYATVAAKKSPEIAVACNAGKSPVIVID
ncbi:MAG TPA: hypothetical protein VHR18_09345 [Solirubrobacterales bacterium]|jgi:hypothetical protein|nr:hypothetical protein [Solirubrobacterales bacterium]